MCATKDTYCISGLTPNDGSSVICSEYIRDGIINGCPYFKHNQLPSFMEYDIYLYWDSTLELWMIGNNYTEPVVYGFCDQNVLDNCKQGSWYLLRYGEFYKINTVTISLCAQNNTECVNDMDGVLGRDYCFYNTTHRSVNVDIKGKYESKKCSENKPYFMHNKQVSVEVNGIHSVATLAWDDEMSVWFISYEYNITSANAVAYCKSKNLDECSQNWYIYDGTTMTLDRSVNSGYCDTCCKDVNVADICIQGGITKEDVGLIGMYRYNSCQDLLPKYVHSVDGIDLIVYYDSYVNELYIGNDDDYILYCEGSDIMNCSDNWFFKDNNNTTSNVIVSACDDITSQCDKICKEFDVNNDSYIYKECDSAGFPIFYASNGSTKISMFNQLNISDSITFLYAYVITSMDESVIFGYCVSLSFEYCHHNWWIYDMNTQQYTPYTSSSVSQCPIETLVPTKTNIYHIP